MSKQICDTALTIDEVEAAINRRLKTSAKITDWTAEDIGTGKGFLSVMARVKMNWDQANHKLPESVIIKLTTLKKLSLIMGSAPGMKEMMSKMVNWLPQIHNAEVSVFEVFSKLEKPPAPIPFMYECKRMEQDVEGKQLGESGNAYIIMEDLSEKGGIVNMIGCERLSQEQHKQLMRAYARLHSWSVKADLSKFEFLDFQMMSDMMLDSVDSMNEGLRTSVKSDEWQKKLGPLADHVEEAFMDKRGFLDIAQCNSKYGIPDSFCQGDVHTNNMLFEKDNEGKSSGDLMVLLDWQIINFGNPISDIMRPMVLNCDHANRTVEWRNSLLDVYYEEYEKCLGKTPPFTVDQLYQCAQETYVLACKFFMGFFAGMVVSVRAGNIPGVDPEKSANQILSDTRDIFSDIVLAQKGVRL